MLASWYAYATASHPDKLPYDLSFWRAGLSVAGTAVSALLTHRRAPAALPVAAATAASTVLLGALNKRKSGAYVTRTWRKDSVKEKIFNTVMPAAHAVESAALVALAAARSKRSAVSAIAQGARVAAPAAARTARAANGSARHNLRSAAAAATHSLRPAADSATQSALLPYPWYPHARKLGLYFMTFSLVGHWGEMLFCTGIKYGLFKGGYDRENHMLWDQWLFPFPAEGTAAVLADLVLMPLKNAIVQAFDARAAAGLIPRGLAHPLSLGASFLANQVLCTAIDFTTGMVANRHYELWDYRDMRFHFMGQVCLQNSLFYTAVATWGVWQLLPALEQLMGRLKDETLDGIFVGLGSVFLFLTLLYHIILPDDGDPEASAEGRE